jgi:hypothetical protein
MLFNLIHGYLSALIEGHRIGKEKKRRKKKDK